MKLDAGIRKVAQLTGELSDESYDTLTDQQRDDIHAIQDGVDKFQLEMEDFPDFSTQTAQQLGVLRHDLRNHLNLVNGFAYVLVKGLSGEISEHKQQLAQQIHITSKALITIVNMIS
jgi:hypothetical protein